MAKKLVGVLLTQDLEGQGKKGEAIFVRPGFARNFLLPKGLAVLPKPKRPPRLINKKKPQATVKIKKKGK